MKFHTLAVAGAFVIEPERIEDDRGFFARMFSQDEFAAHGLNPRLVQASISFNRRRGTLRGMHFQKRPHEEAKIVRCTRGRAYDVVLDLRTGSATHGRWAAAEISMDNRRMVYVPEGCAHGFQTLEDDTELAYQMSEFFHPESGAGVRWDDPAFAITWPISQPILNERDRGYAPYVPAC